MSLRGAVGDLQCRASQPRLGASVVGPGDTAMSALTQDQIVTFGRDGSLMAENAVTPEQLTGFNG